MSIRGGIGSTGYGMKRVGISTPGSPNYRDTSPSAFSIPHTITTGDFIQPEIKQKENVQLNDEVNEDNKRDENNEQLENTDESSV